MRPEPWGDALDAVARRPTARDARAAAGRPDARRAAVHPGAGPRAGAPSRGWCSPAAATRASTSGCSTRLGDAGAGRPRSRLGDYVLNGGEVAVLVIVEAVARLLPGVIGNAESLVDESHAGRACSRRPATPSRPTWRGRDGARRAALRRPRPDRPLAARRVAAPHRRPPPGPARPRSTRRALDRARPGLLAGRLGWSTAGRTVDWSVTAPPVAD